MTKEQLSEGMLVIVNGSIDKTPCEIACIFHTGSESDDADILLHGKLGIYCPSMLGPV